MCEEVHAEHTFKPGGKEDRTIFWQGEGGGHTVKPVSLKKLSESDRTYATGTRAWVA